MINQLVEEKILDKEAMEILAETFGDEYLALIKDFFVLVPQHILKLKTAINSKNDDEIYVHAHTIKGMAANLGFLNFASVCQELEIAARKHLLSDYVAALNSLDSVASTIQKYLAG